MAYRCPDCNTFVSVECIAEVESLELDAESQTVRAEVRLTLECANCSNELAEVTVEGEDSFDHQHWDEFDKKKKEWLADEALELEDDCPEAEFVDRFEGKGRYAKHSYGADVPYGIKCVTCEGKVVITGNIHVEEQASCFEQTY